MRRCSCAAVAPSDRLYVGKLHTSGAAASWRGCARSLRPGMVSRSGVRERCLRCDTPAALTKALRHVRLHSGGVCGPDAGSEGAFGRLKVSTYFALATRHGHNAASGALSTGLVLTPAPTAQIDAKARSGSSLTPMSRALVVRCAFERTRLVWPIMGAPTGAPELHVGG